MYSFLVCVQCTCIHNTHKFYLIYQPAVNRFIHSNESVYIHRRQAKIVNKTYQIVISFSILLISISISICPFYSASEFPWTHAHPKQYMYIDIKWNKLIWIIEWISVHLHSHRFYRPNLWFFQHIAFQIVLNNTQTE